MKRVKYPFMWLNGWQGPFYPHELNPLMEAYDNAQWTIEQLGTASSQIKGFVKVIKPFKSGGPGKYVWLCGLHFCAIVHNMNVGEIVIALPWSMEGYDAITQEKVQPPHIAIYFTGFGFIGMPQIIKDLHNNLLQLPKR